MVRQGCAVCALVVVKTSLILLLEDVPRLKKLGQIVQSK